MNRSSRTRDAGAPDDAAAPAAAGKRNLTQALSARRAPPSAADVATATIEGKDGGAPVDARLRAEVGAQLGAPVPEARVHQDAEAQAGAAAIGARAFAHGQDIFLGPGESAGDRSLMAHELTHVAQQAGTVPGVQAKVEVGAPGTPAEQHADAVAGAVTSGQAPANLLVDDEATPTSAQMRKSDFLAKLKPLLEEAAGDELGPIWSVAGCPYIARYLEAYANRPAAVGEAFLRKFTGGQATTAEGLIAPMIARMRVGIRQWRDTGTVPPEVAAADPGAAAAAATSAKAGPSAQLLPAEGAQPVDARVAAAAGDALGVDLGGVRVHTGPAADRLAAAHGAQAVSRGQDIAFRSGAYQPGTPAGDALLGHELAHAAQQDGATEEASGDEAADEAGADQAATGVVARLWSGLSGLVQRAVSPTRGLALRRCGDDPAPLAREMDKARYQEIEQELRDLLARKQALVDGTGTGDMAAIDGEIDTLIDELRSDFGVRVDKGAILDAAKAKKDMLVVDGRVLVAPSGEHYFGQRMTFQAEIDHVPPGEKLEVGWRWHDKNRSFPGGYKFLTLGPTLADKTTELAFALDTPFWGLNPDAIQRDQGLEAIAHVYVGGNEVKEISSGWIPLVAKVPEKIDIVGVPPRMLKDAYADMGIGPWTPDFSHHLIEWYVDDKLVGADRLGMRYQFAATGNHTVRADVYEVERNFGVGNKRFLRSATTTIEVLDQTAYGEAFLDEAEKSPLTPKPVGLKETLSTGDKALEQVQGHIDQGGTETPYWEERKKAQKERLDKIRELAPDLDKAEALPADPAAVQAGHSYSGPVTAILVMPSSGGAQPLTVHMNIAEKGGVWTARIIDSTSRKVLKYDGTGASALAAYEAVFADWKADNPYPTGGRIAHRFAPTGWTQGNGFETYTDWKRAKEWVDGILMVGTLIIGGLLLAAPDATITKVLGAAMVAAVVARSSVAIYERLDAGGDVFSTENVLDGIAIVTSVFGVSGTVLRSVGLKAVSPLAYRAGNWMIMASLAGDVGTFVYASTEAIAALRAIEADPTRDDSEKAAEMFRIMASLFASAALLIVSNRELLKNGLKPNDFIKSKLEPGAKTELDAGARLDAEYELKQAGKWSKETSKLGDDALLDRVFTNRSVKEIEARLGKLAKPEEVKKLIAALGDDKFLALSTAAGDAHLGALVSTHGGAKVADALTRLAPEVMIKLTKAGGPASVDTLIAAFDLVKVERGPGGAGGDATYNYGGTSKADKELRKLGKRVEKTNDPADGTRKLTVQTDDGPVTFLERGRYADVRIDPAKLGDADRRALEKLYGDFGITDDGVKGRVLELIESARIENPSLSVDGAIKKVRPTLEKTKTAAEAASTTTEAMLQGQGKAPITDPADAALVKQAKDLIDGGILKDPQFQAARTPAEARDVLSEHLKIAHGETRAGELGLTGGRPLRRIKIVGDLYQNATGPDLHVSKSGQPVKDTDVAPDIDVAYVVPAGGKEHLGYVGSVKIVDGKGAKKAQADAANQNQRAQDAIAAGTNRFEVTTRSNEKAWGEVKKIEGLDAGGAPVDLTGKLVWDAGTTAETVGSSNTTGFGSKLKVSADELNKLADLVWRGAELGTR